MWTQGSSSLLVGLQNGYVCSWKESLLTWTQASWLWSSFFKHLFVTFVHVKRHIPVPWWDLILVLRNLILLPGENSKERRKNCRKLRHEKTDLFQSVASRLQDNRRRVCNKKKLTFNHPQQAAAVSFFFLRFKNCCCLCCKKAKQNINLQPWCAERWYFIPFCPSFDHIRVQLQRNLETEVHE